MHVHIGLLGFVTWSLYAMVFGFFWHMATMKFHNTPIGQAMAFIF